MNGRIYDPLIGRMLSADTVVQFPGDLQSYNRYSYVRNNPLTKTDPSGFEEGEEPAEFAAEVQTAAQVRYEAKVQQANEVLRKDGHLAYVEFFEKEVRPAAHAAGERVIGDPDYEPHFIPGLEFRAAEPSPRNARNLDTIAKNEIEPRPANGAVEQPAAKGDKQDELAPVVFRYVGPNEAKKAGETGMIPNTDREGNPKDVFVTPDKHDTAPPFLSS